MPGTNEFEVRNEEIEARIKVIGERLRASMPVGEEWGFALLIFSFGPGGAMFYTSNAQRDDVCRAMEEFVARQRPTPAN